VLIALACARWLRFGLLFGLFLSLLLFLQVSGFPAVRDLGQEFTELFYVFFCPHMNAKLAVGHGWRRGYFPGGYIPAETHVGQAELFGRFAGGEGRHAFHMLHIEIRMSIKIWKMQPQRGLRMQRNQGVESF